MCPDKYQTTIFRCKNLKSVAWHCLPSSWVLKRYYATKISILDREILIILQKTYFCPSCRLQTSFQTNSNNNILWKKEEFGKRVILVFSTRRNPTSSPGAVSFQQLDFGSATLGASFLGVSFRKLTGRFLLKKALL